MERDPANLVEKVLTESGLQAVEKLHRSSNLGAVFLDPPQSTEDAARWRIQVPGTVAALLLV